jgi:hypothetical protein
VISIFSRSSMRSRCILVKLHSNVSSGRYTALQKGIPPRVRILNGFCRSGKLRIPKAIAKPQESLESLQILETLSSLIAQKTLNKPEQPENAEHKKEMLETLKTQHNYNNQRTRKKQRNSIIRKTTLPPAAGRDVPQNPLHLRVLHP